MSQNEIERYLKNVYLPVTTKISSNCRYMVYAIIAACWGIIATDSQDVLPRIDFKVAIKLFALYLSIDLIQYLIHAGSFYGLYWKNLHPNNKDIESSINKVEIITWCIFFVKITYLFVIFWALVFRA